MPKDYLNNSDMLARLVAQAVEDGGDLVTLRAIVEESCELGARRTLNRIGLADPTAPNDVTELRELLSAWRDAKSSARKAAFTWIMRMVLALLLLGLAVRFGATEMLK